MASSERRGVGSSLWLGILAVMMCVSAVMVGHVVLSAASYQSPLAAVGKQLNECF